MQVEQIVVSEGSSLLSYLSPPLHLNLLFGSLADILWIVSYGVVRTTTYETILIFPLIQLNHIGKMDNIPDQLICSTNPT